jgi:hypothetical protein
MKFNGVKLNGVKYAQRSSNYLLQDIYLFYIENNIITSCRTEPA